MSDLSFVRFRNANLARCIEKFHKVDEWSETDWATALAGEVGELCNLIKKRRRGEKIAIADVAAEMGDVFAYLDLLATRMGISLPEAVTDKFNAVSRRVGSDITV